MCEREEEREREGEREREIETEIETEREREEREREIETARVRNAHLLFRKSWIDHKYNTIDGQRSFSDIGAYYKIKNSKLKQIKRI